MVKMGIFERQRHRARALSNLLLESKEGRRVVPEHCDAALGRHFLASPLPELGPSAQIACVAKSTGSLRGLSTQTYP